MRNRIVSAVALMTLMAGAAQAQPANFNVDQVLQWVGQMQPSGPYSNQNYQNPNYQNPNYQNNNYPQQGVYVDPYAPQAPQGYYPGYAPGQLPQGYTEGYLPVDPRANQGYNQGYNQGQNPYRVWTPDPWVGTPNARTPNNPGTNWNPDGSWNPHGYQPDPPVQPPVGPYK